MSRLKMAKNEMHSSKRSLQIDLYLKGKKIDFCVLKKCNLTKRFKKQNEEKLGIHLSDDEVIHKNVYIKNKKIQNIVDAHFDV